VTEEDVVAEHQGRGAAVQVVRTDEERLRQSVRRGLDGVLQRDTPLRAVPEQPDELVLVMGCGDDEDVPEAGQHEHRQRVVDHRLVVDREQLLAHRAGNRMKSGARAPGQDDPFHGTPP
jgi:hypothetical protein